ncbi:MAG TPA: EAL domain-containing protein [Burkholderiaceae bacterium]|nr:EAL domain-containing protein [Burkholderiaceae bacterium]
MRRVFANLICWLLLVGGVAVSLLTWHGTASRIDQQSRQRFEHEFRGLVGDIERQLQHHASLLLALRAVLESAAEPDLQRSLRGVELRQSYPGLHSLQLQHADGRTERFVPERDALVRAASPGYAAAATAALADWRSNARGRRAPLLSAPFEQADGERTQQAVVLGVTLNRPEPPRASAADRRVVHPSDLTMIVLAEPMLGDALIDSSVAHNELRLLDLGPVETARLDRKTRADSALVYRTGEFQPSSDKGLMQRRLELEALLHFGGRVWAVQAAQRAAPGHLRALPLLILIGGTAASVMLFGLFLALAMQHRRAAALALRLSQEARDSEHRMRALLHSTVDGIVTIDEAGRIESVNPAVERIFGCSAAELAGSEFTMLLREEERRRFDELRAECLPQAAGTALRASLETIGMAPDGRCFPLELALSSVDGSEGTRLVCVLRDLTERRRAARLLDQANALRRAVFESAALAIIATDARGLIEAMNPAAERMLGYREQELRGRFTLDLLHDTKELAAYAATLPRVGGLPVAPSADALLSRARLGGTEEREWTYICKDGGRLPVRQSVTAMRDGSASISGYVIVAQDISEQKRSEEHIRRLAHYDTLTGLPNRTLLAERLSTALANARQHGLRVGILLVDLDRFKVINDSLGHAAGDELLRSVSRRLLSCVRGGDTVARMGGDEFVVVLSEMADAGIATDVAQRIIRLLGEPIELGGNELRVTASIGISVFPDDGAEPALLLRNADTSMYRAKDSGRNAFRSFSPEMGGSALPRLELERDLYHALEQQQFVVHYQPQIDLASGRVVGAEALLRWQRGDALVPPTTFIPIAEETGLIVPIGEWVLRTACADLKRWNDGALAGWTVSVNISPRQFRDPNLLDRVREILAESGIEPWRLELEITEGVLMESERETLEALTALRELGVKLALDDFGTGYSSLAYLKRFTIDKLKIDRAFVSGAASDPSSAALTRAIIAMSHSLDISVVAEGVETREQLEFLRQHQCDQAQGYLLGRPAPAAGFLARARSDTSVLAVASMPHDAAAVAAPVTAPAPDHPPPARVRARDTDPHAAPAA